MGKNKDKDKDKGKNGKSGEKSAPDKASDTKATETASAATSASTAETAPSGAKAPRVHKEILDQFLDNGSKAKKFTARLHRSTHVWTGNVEEQYRADLAGMKQVLEEIAPRLDDVLVHLASLKTKGFKPATAPRGPRFSVGQKVRVDGEWMEKHLESGFYTKEELSDMTVLKISEKEILVKTSAGNLLPFRLAHLEPVESVDDDSSDDAADDDDMSGVNSSETESEAAAS